MCQFDVFDRSIVRGSCVCIDVVGGLGLVALDLPVYKVDKKQNLLRLKQVLRVSCSFLGEFMEG